MKFTCFPLACLCLFFVHNASSQGLQPLNNFRQVDAPSFVDPRRQLSATQQGHILSDIQQHQHRYVAHQTQQNPGLTQQRYLQQPSIQLGHVVFPSQVPVQQQLHSRVLNPLNQPSFANSQNQFLPQQSQTSFQGEIPNGRVPPHRPNSVHQHHTQTGFTPNFVQQQQQQQIIQQAPQQQQQQIIQQAPHQQQPLINQFFQQNNPQLNQINQNSQPLNSQKEIFNGQFQQSPAAAPIFTRDQTGQLQNYFEQQREQERARELREKQLIIQKHEQFVAKQQQKQYAKVQQLHNEFINKQQSKQFPTLHLTRPEHVLPLHLRPTKSRQLLPYETNLFQQALSIYEAEHPTTPAPTKPTTTTTTTTTTVRTTKKPKPRVAAPKSKVSRSELDPESFLQEERQKLYDHLSQSIRYQTDRTPRQQPTDNTEEKPKSKSNHPKLYERQDLLRQLKLAIGDNASNDKNLTSMEITLPNGQKVQVIRTTDPNLIQGAVPLSSDSSAIAKAVSLPPSTTTKALPPQAVSFEELTKGVLPPGADFEVIKQSGNGQLEEVGKIPPTLLNQKKVTFVYLEEQQDGSLKVQGVRGNGDKKEQSSGAEYDSILKRIQDGEIQLPSPSPKPVLTSPSTIYTTRDADTLSTVYHRSTEQPQYSTNSISYQSTSATPTSASETDIVQSVTFSPSSHTSSVSQKRITDEQSYITNPIFHSSTVSTTPASVKPEVFYPTVLAPESEQSPYSTVATIQTSTQLPQRPSSAPTYANTAGISTTNLGSASNNKLYPSQPATTFHPSSHSQFSDQIVRSTTTRSVTNVEVTPSVTPSSGLPELTDILKDEGLFAMSKYLKQSGLDTILNETGPYTVFAPTDKAFRNLLIQLGGPEKAEEKFKSNPRLLSGLLLHHVIPGAFEISALQDEMTGVSLAGTQLRVNQYSMHDAEWNDVKVTTINGAKIVSEKSDVGIPQGIAHAVDQVMFPLPVGDLLQTLQSDRERRFTHFLRALYASGLHESLSGSKTFTVFAPTDASFSSLSATELNHLVTDKEAAKALVTRHVTPGSLFSAGMRYYQVKDSMQNGKPITLQKNGGRIKVNSGHIITNNIPTTNGVIHAVDTLL